IRENENGTIHGSSSHLMSEYTQPRNRHKLMIIILVIVVLILGLSIGLGVGLKKSDNHGSAQAVEGGHSEEKKTTHPETSTSVLISTTTSSTQAPNPEFWTCHPPPDTQCPWSKNPVLLVSMDGFRADYMLRNVTPTIQKLMDCGVHTPYMRAVYPTLTFPNHYTIATGLYPESHGIVGNSMYDPVINQSFSLGSTVASNPAWWQGEPLWITAKNQGKRTASYFWVGSDVNITGVLPDIWKKYNGSVPFEERVDTVLEWLQLPKGERPDFITLYFSEPDHWGHEYGPYSQQVNEMLENMDKIISRLVNGLHNQKMLHCVNTIIVADHGMEETSCDRRFILDQYMDIHQVLIYDGTTGHINTKYHKHGSVVVKSDSAVPVHSVIDQLECKSSHLNVYTKENVPERHHYTNSRRIGDVIMDVEARWLVYGQKGSTCLAGNHGYDNIYKSMHALFLAYGPDFKKNFTTPPFENIELYNMMAELLGIEPAPNNGTLGSLHHILSSPSPLNEEPDPKQYSTCSGPRETYGEIINMNCSCTNPLTYVPPSENQTYTPPFNKPALEVSMPTCVLPQRQFLTGFSQMQKMPDWISYTLTQQQVGNIKKNQSDHCVIYDNRLSIEENPVCDNYQNYEKNISFYHLYDPGYAWNNEEVLEASLSSTIVPVYNGFRDGIWSYMLKALRDIVRNHGDVHVTMGPVFDYDGDGLWSNNQNATKFVDEEGKVPIPTHFYVILIRCTAAGTLLSKCPAETLETQTFILPHQPTIHNCLPERDYLKNNIARIRDVELVTGLRFLTSFSRNVSAQLRTHLTTELWESVYTESWEDLPCTAPENQQCPNGPVPLLLISLDGFRAEYLLRNISPTIQKLSQCGVHTPYMRAVYPTITFPNHYTIVTGLYPESHGIISNNMYDEDINQIFTLSSSTKSDPRWWKGEPLWIRAQKQGLRTATYFWPGSDVNITGRYPDEWKMYDGKVGFPERLSTVIDWLTLPAEQRPHFVTLYFDEPDHAGHEKGPESAMVEGQIETVDEIINRLMNGLYQRGLHNCVNIIILADHGFGDLSCGKTVELKPWYHNITNMLMFEGVVGQVFPHFKKQNSTHVTRQNTSFPLDEIVQDLTCRSQAMKVFTKDTLPKRHHYTVSNRIGDLILDMKEEWLVFDDRVNYCTGGSHGWDNTNKHMHALFLAHGPGFKKNYRADPFENIELYNLMSELLGIVPAANNGTTGSLHHILQNSKNLTSQKFPESYSQCTAASISKNNLVSECGNCLYENQTLDDVSDIHNTSSAHLVFGVPDMLESSLNTCILYQKNSVTAFSQLYMSPVWMSSILTQDQLKNQTVENVGSPCIVKDTRLANLTSTNCSHYRENITAYPLFNPAFVNLGSHIFLSSETVPMYNGFINGSWRYLWELAADYVKTFDNISVTVGPVYDYNHDGLWEGITNKTRFADDQDEVPMPTHLYVILVKCKTLKTKLPCGGEVDVLSFILPNQPKDPNCLKNKDFLIDNAARIRDIELLVGLNFLTSFDTSMAARIRTFLPEELWPSELTQDWIDFPCPTKSQCQTDYQPILLISLDGFRADYLLRNFTPHIGRLSQCGIHAPYMRSVYPTKTFPNHYTIVTGLYPESHGIIDNNMYDLNIGNRFSLSSPNASDTRWWGGEPIWITAQKQGHKTATFFWPGSDVKIQGMFPNYYEKYDGSVPYSSRIEKALAWMEMPADQRPDFITLYLDEPDLAGHKYGPTNTEYIGAALERVDEAIGQLMDGLYERKLHNCVNIIIIADHGMDDVSCKRVIRLKDYIDSNLMSQHSYVWDGPFGRMATKYIYHNNVIIPATEPVEPSVFLKNLTCATHMKAYEKNQLPVRHHYINNQRIDDIILDVETGWLVTRNFIQTCQGGNHGYDNLYKSMQALFLAYGPAFKWNLMVEPFENIELYNLFAEMLNITAAPNNGTEGSLDHLLQQPLNRNRMPTNVQYSINNIDDSAFQEMLQQRLCGRGCPQPALKAHVETKQSVVPMEIPVSSAGSADMHLPWGPPVLQALYPNNSIQLLYQPSHVTAYFPSLHLPLWVSQTIQKSQLSSSYADMKCSIPDSRVDANRNCSVSKEGFTFQSLLLTELKSSSGAMSTFLSSSFVDMKEHFASETWLKVKNLVKQWIDIYGLVNIMTGPVFDTNHDGLSDTTHEIHRYFNGSIPVPTHLYLVLTRCNKTGESLENCAKFQTASYILPHQSNITSCQNISNYMTDNEARVRDVELISGLEFFPKMDKSLSVQLRTFLPSGLWTTK
ncbi:hypothetical protein CHS0354_026532, partial [Potamilus streckersoni]